MTADDRQSPEMLSYPREIGSDGKQVSFVQHIANLYPEVQEVLYALDRATARIAELEAEKADLSREYGSGALDVDIYDVIESAFNEKRDRIAELEALLRTARAAPIADPWTNHPDETVLLHDIDVALAPEKAGSHE